MNNRRTSLHSCVAVMLFLGGCSARQQPNVNREAALIKDFTDRVGKYVELHKRLEGELPSLKDQSDATRIASHKVALANALRAARTNARPGDLFFEEVRPIFVRTIRSEVRGPGGADARATINEGNPKVEANPAKIQMAVNAPYPDDAPLSSVPPTLLLKLPRLPEEVDYRFIGRDLILRDVAANIIVDFMKGAVP